MSEQLEFGGDGAVDHAGIKLRLDEMFESARAEGMSQKGLARAEKMLREKIFNVWRLKLQPGDVADIPPLKIELKEGKISCCPSPIADAIPLPN